MKNLLLILIFSFALIKVYSQSFRVAILDFENISGIAKYDGLGKAMSSMLISDIEANVSPEKLQLVERAQIQKVLKEQKFQTSGNVNKNTAVQAGKILGVNYLLVGDIYILNDQLIINARLTNTETGDIVFSKKQEGKIVGWLTLKTNIAKDLAKSLSTPIIESESKNKDYIDDANKISVESILAFSDVLDKVDNFEFNEALVKLQLCENIPDEYLSNCEKIIRRQIYMYKFEHVIKKVLNGKVNCNILLEIDSQFGIENYGSIEYHKFFIEQNLDSLGAREFLLKKNNHRKDLKLDTFKNITDWQDFTYSQIIEYKKMLDIILNSENLPTNCEIEVKECAIGYWLTFFNDYVETISYNSRSERREEMKEMYKTYFQKLISLNPNSNQLNFVSFRRFKSRFDLYINYVSQFNKN